MQPEPFAYPPTPHIRRHGPRGYAQYESYREWLRDEFSFRCVFCLYREQWPGSQSFQIDHLLPRAQYPEKECDYVNLVYVCPRCNGIKLAKRVPDPCRIALGKSLQVHPDGRIRALNLHGRLLLKALRLDNDAHTQTRRLLVGILETCFRHNRPQFVLLMGYPKNLVDLGRLDPPHGNTRPAGVRDSAYARRQRGDLPEVY